MTDLERAQREHDLKLAKQAVDRREPDLAYQLANPWTVANVNDAEALYCVACAAELGEKLPIAYYFAKRVTELRPEKWAGWLLLGNVCGRLWLLDEAERASRKAIKLAQTPEAKADTLTNLGAFYVNHGEFSRARPLLEEAMKENPASVGARGNLGICLLAERQWDPGWRMYHYTLGSAVRRRIRFGDEPEWDGTPGLTVVLWGEQGLGDELSFASMLPEAINDCEKVIVDCDPRLLNLFRRSFPRAKFYGTRKDMKLAWDAEDRNFQASAPFGALGQFYRTKDADFTGEPYLVPDPDRVTMWKALWETKRDPMTGEKKPTIGIAWSGGTELTGKRFRQWSLAELSPLLELIPAHWVSLQYKDSQAEIDDYCNVHSTVDLNQYRFGTLTRDYDDTAALVASLDHVISMQTAVVHLAGALGMSCDVFVPKTSQWRYGEKWTALPWYKSVKVIRQSVRGHWSNAISDYAEQLAGITAARAA